MRNTLGPITTHRLIYQILFFEDALLHVFLQTITNRRNAINAFNKAAIETITTNLNFIVR